MASIDDFLKDAPHLVGNTALKSESVILNVVVVGSTEKNLEFFHLGKIFSVSRDDVLSLEDSPHPQGVAPNSGKPAIIRLRNDAVISWCNTMSAADLLASIPFGMAIPSIAPPALPERPLVTEWRQRMGYAPRSYQPLASSVPSESVSGGVYDDSTNDYYD